MKKKLLLAAAVVAALVAAVVPSTMATTTPGVNITVTVKVSDTGIQISPASGRRGWAAHFVITNVGTKPHDFFIGGLKTKAIPPGGKAKLGASLEDRGNFPFKVTLNPGPKQSGFFKVV